MRIAVTGASGMVGTRLVAALRAEGHEVLTVGRAKKENGPDIEWSPAEHGLNAQALAGVEAVFHLAGEPIAQRWSAEVKRRIRTSRVEGTSLLAGALAGLPQRPQLLVSMSAIGFYGDRGAQELSEECSAGAGFLADVAMEWESAADPARAAGIRVVHSRLGVVLDKDGGALERMVPIFSLGAGGKIASGEQYMSWISLTDVIGGLRFLLDADLEGAVNLTAPHPVTNAAFTAALARVLSRPAIATVPEFAVKLAFGEMGMEVLVAGQRVMPAKLLAAGFQFTHTDIEGALRAAL